MVRNASVFDDNEMIQIYYSLILFYENLIFYKTYQRKVDEMIDVYLLLIITFKFYI